jgi:hypothetical protein
MVGESKGSVILKKRENIPAPSVAAFKRTEGD